MCAMFSGFRRLDSIHNVIENNYIMVCIVEVKLIINANYNELL